MNKKVFFFIGIVSIMFIEEVKSQSEADTLDPLFVNYSLGASAELILQYASRTENQNKVLYDFNSGMLEKKFKENINNNGGGLRCIDVITGDFNGDFVDDIVSVWQNVQDRGNDYYPLSLTIPLLKKGGLTWTTQTDTIIAKDCGNMFRLMSGNFDYDNPKEFIVAYSDANYKTHIILLETDSILKPHVLDRISIPQESIWDICTSDFDRDGLDELVMVIPFGLEKYNNDSFTLKSHVKVFDYSPNGNGFSEKSSNIICTNNKNFNYFFGKLEISLAANTINNVAISSGNFDDDDDQEIAYVFELSYSGNGRINRVTYFDVSEKSFDSPIDTKNSQFAAPNFLLPQNIVIDDPGEFGYTTDVVAADFNTDNRDEIVTFCNGRLNVFNAELNDWYLNEEVYSKFMFNSHNLLAVADMDADTADNSSLTPEVVLLSIENDSIVLTVYKLKVDPVRHTIEQSYNNVRIKTGLAVNDIYTCAIALGDFDGDGIHLGKPTRLVEKSVFIPTVIVNAPPSHFDILDAPYDVNYFYSPWSPSCPKPLTSTIYKETSDRTVTCLTELKRDWKVSNEVKYGKKFKLFDLGFEVKLTGAYGEKFSKKKENTKSISITSTRTADKDDFVFGMVVNYYLFEYPIFYKGNTYGNILVTCPILQNEIGNYSKNLGYSNYSFKHEPNNLLSYPYCNQINDNSDLAEGIHSGYIFGKQFGLSSTLNPNDWKLDVSELNIENISKSNEFNVGMEVSATGWGLGLKVNGEYGQEGLTSHVTSIKDGFSVLATFDRVNKSIGEVEYSLKPYVYWSKSGALVIDYNVVLDGLWWDKNYGKKPDLAFIMPYRYSPEKNETLTFESKRMLTSDIRYFPYDAKPGDSITIMATIRNFCLNNDVPEAKVNFYLGDPDNYGELIKTFTIKNIKARNSTVLQFNWKTPKTITNPWIFAIIDPDNKIAEIHKNNNKGFTQLFTKSFPSFTPLKVSENNNNDDLQLSSYPNPAKKQTILQFNLKKRGTVSLSVFNTLGQKIEERLIQNPNPGWQFIELDVSTYAPGVYFYQIASYSFKVTQKIIVE